MSFVGRQEVDRIIVFGHSFNRVDKPYYEDILVPRFSDRPWTFVAYNEEDVGQAEVFCAEMGIGDCTIVSDRGKEVVDLSWGLGGSFSVSYRWPTSLGLEIRPLTQDQTFPKRYRAS